MSLQFPFDLDDELSDVVKLRVTVYNDDFESENDFTLEIQRESYNVEVLSIDTEGRVIAGQQFAVDVVLKNRGMRDLEDLFVTARIPGLGVERRAFFKDVFALDDTQDDEHDEDDSVFGRIYLSIPENAKSGVYTLEVTARNDDVTAIASDEFVVESRFEGEPVVIPTIGKTFNVGEEATYEVLIVNPSSTLKIYSIVPESGDGLDVMAEETVVAIPAGSSKNVALTVKASEAGTQKFSVSVFAGNDLVKSAELTANVKEAETSRITGTTNPIVVLTVVLAIIFVVLLIVLIALLSRKPQKSEEFGESYY